MFVLAAKFEKEIWYYQEDGKWDQDIYLAFFYPDTAKSSVEALVTLFVLTDRFFGSHVSYEIMEV